MENNNNFWCTQVSTVREHGILSAAIISRIQFWCDYNEKNKIKDRFYDGYWWSGYMRPEDFEEQLGVAHSTIKKNIYKLIKDGILIKAKYNKKGFDRTNWYRYNGLYQNGPMDWTNSVQSIISNQSNGKVQNGTMESTELDQTIPVNLSVNSSINSKSVKPSVNPPLNPIVHRSAGEIQLEQYSKLKEKIKFNFFEYFKDEHQQHNFLFKWIEQSSYKNIENRIKRDLTIEEIKLFETYVDSKP